MLAICTSAFLPLVVLMVFAGQLEGDTTGEPCNSNPCQNGGICVGTPGNNETMTNDHVTQSGYYCRCLQCYIGTDCHTHLPECHMHCYNGGHCVMDSYCREACECATCFRGSYCEIVSDGCLTSPCNNGGVCRETGDKCNDFECTCQQCYLGQYCSVVDEVCLNEFATTIVFTTQNFASNESYSTLSLDSNEKEELLMRITIGVSAALATVVILAVWIICWMYCRIKKNDKKIVEKDMQITRMAILRDQMYLGFVSNPPQQTEEPNEHGKYTDVRFEDSHEQTGEGSSNSSGNERVEPPAIIISPDVEYSPQSSRRRQSRRDGNTSTVIKNNNTRDSDGVIVSLTGTTSADELNTDPRRNRRKSSPTKNHTSPRRLRPSSPPRRAHKSHQVEIGDADESIELGTVSNRGNTGDQMTEEDSLQPGKRKKRRGGGAPVIARVFVGDFPNLLSCFGSD
ncbi:uncharacterized protein LOC100376346 [Saccoglossus kowalevskii]|uniref:Neurogenic locus protein delta-like n=1 Tax=Saccoglossus kowalevskii TaxID=10224 RepID=A0ABM0H1G9_SACKO|nr:PREDICTED: neurogenic locus protein delta-like [Saccoglossus kowalevskii]